MKKEIVKRYFKFFLKITITTVALWFVFKKVDFQEFLNTISEANIFWFILAVAAFNGSKIVSAFRIRHYYEAVKLYLDNWFNVKLYYVGMFYNLFLPGAIGGDGYKVYLLKQGTTTKTKDLISATLLDRLSGLILLFFLGCFLLIFSSYESPFDAFHALIVVLALVSIPVSYYLLKWIFPVFISKFWITFYLSFWVQIGQVICAFFILKALQVEVHYFDYLTLFMASSIVAVLPFTVGGVGARELVFIYGYQYLNIEKPTAIAFTILFFASTAITALIGLVLSYKLNFKTNPFSVENEKEPTTHNQ
ncbi:MAG: lysylphosphatidylglycerol synthase transmembrane domain-containing protein [Candidatus Cyclobacteriaceae bacterium M3_2C_046]